MTVAPLPALTRPVVLVGLMGAGKSTVGRRLAQRLQLPFFDSDAEIAAAAGLSVSEIFARHGEAAFRSGERKVIARLLDDEIAVIATGGGAFIQPETRALILARAHAVWIDADLDLLAERVSRRDDRPLLYGRDPRAALAELAAIRNPLYALAPIRVTSGNRAHAVVVEAIVEELRRCR